MKSFQNLVLLQNLYRMKALGFEYSDSFVMNQKSSLHLPKTVEALENMLQNCHLCDLSKSRTQTMVGCGNSNADIMFIDYQVSQKQDNENSYYIGRSGEMLQKMVENVLNLSIEDVYYTHALKCKPLENNYPSSSEWNSCSSYLYAQIEMIQPKVIVTLGEEAFEHLVMNDEKFLNVRGHVIAFKEYQLVPIYHPNYLLRNPELKKSVLNDLHTIKSCLT